jgi:hypothetical protein
MKNSMFTDSMETGKIKKNGFSIWKICVRQNLFFNILIRHKQINSSLSAEEVKREAVTVMTNLEIMNSYSNQSSEIIQICG